MSEKKQPKKNLSRKSKRRIISWALICLVTAAVILLNIISVTLTDKFAFMTADITEKSNFELTEQSVKIADSVKKSVTITFLTSKANLESSNTYNRQTSEIARQFAQNSDGMIDVKYIDLVKNPTFESQFPNENLQTSSIIIECGEKYQILDKYDIYNYETYTGNTLYEYITSSKAEEAIDSAILRVTSDATAKIAIIKDNTEKDYSYLKTELINNSYDVSELNILTEDIPDNTDVIIVYAPAKDYTDSMIKKLEDFLENGGQFGKTLLYVPVGEKADTKNIDAFLETWNLKVEDGLAFDMDTSRITGNSYYDGIVTFYDSKSFTENISENDFPVMMSRARPITLLSEGNVESLIRYSSQSGYCPFDANSEEWSMPDAVTGNVTVAAQAINGDDDKISSVIILGSTYMLESTHMNTYFGNEDYLLNIMADQTGRESSELKIKEKVISEFDLNLSTQSAMIIGAVVFAILPLIILGAGFCVFLVRKNR